jgi:GNAT superfamily N-acetyltransferase
MAVHPSSSSPSTNGSTNLARGDAAGRARAWHHAAQSAVCDVIEPWEHGTVVRASRYPSYFDCNAVRVERDSRLGVAALESFAEEALAGLAHRRLDFELAAQAEPLRARFERNGWLATRLLWMRHETAPARVARVQVEEVPYDAVKDLRVIWHQEDFPDQDTSGFFDQAREVARMRGARVLAIHNRGLPVAFTQFVRGGTAAEITHVYVHPRHRGGGRGDAITRAAIDAAGDAEDLWICADDEDWPKEMYARLGFRPVWRSMQFTRLRGHGTPA